MSGETESYPEFDVKERMCGECAMFVDQFGAKDGYCIFFTNEDHTEYVYKIEKWDDCWQPKETKK